MSNKPWGAVIPDPSQQSRNEQYRDSMMNAVNSNTGNVGTPIINTLFGESLARQEGRFVAFTVQPAEGGFIVCNGPRVVLCTTLEQVGTVVMGQVAAYQLDQMEKDEKTRR